MTLSLNPGFVLLLAALIVWALPRWLRGLVLVAAGVAMAALPLMPQFGDHAVFGQFGLRVVPLRLDALSQWIGLAFAVLSILAALASMTRDRRLEDALLALLLGGAGAAVFAGDLITLAGGASLAAVAVVGLSFSRAQTGAARAAARRIMVWMAIAGLSMPIGVGVFLAEARSVRFDQVGADNFGGLVLMGALGVLAGFPGAHVWLRDAAVRVSVSARPFVLTAMPLLGAYGLARAFAGEASLLPIGLAMAVIGALYTILSDDLRRVCGYAAVACSGFVVACLGAPVGQALAGAAGLAFTTAVGLAVYVLALGAAMERAGASSARALAAGDARFLPLTLVLLVIAGLSLVGWPGFGGYAARALAFDAVAQHGPVWAWPALMMATAAIAVGVLVRPAALVLAPAPQTVAPEATASEPPLTAMALGCTVLAAIGMAPDWLYRLLPQAPTSFNPYQPGDVLAAIQLIAGAGATWAVLRFIGLAPLGRDTLDIDVLWRGPLSWVGRRMADGTLRALAWADRVAHVGWAMTTTRAKAVLADGSGGPGRAPDLVLPVVGVIVFAGVLYAAVVWG